MSNITTKEELKNFITQNLNKLVSSNSIPLGCENLKRTIEQCVGQENKLLLILSLINEKLSQEKPNNRKELIKILSFFSKDMELSSSNVQFLSKILTVVQGNVNQECSSLYGIISNTFGEIIENLFLKREDGISNIEVNNISSIYELFQGFCIYNLKQDDKANHIVGAICLNSLIKTCPLVMQGSYLNYIWKNIITHLDKISFYAKTELLNSLISLIFACEQSFASLAHKTLHRILDFLNDENYMNRKLGLNVVFSLGYFCMNEISPLKDHILEFIKVLKNDKVKEVREIAVQIINLFKEEPEYKVNTNMMSFGKKPNSISELSKENQDKNEILDENYKEIREVKYEPKIKAKPISTQKSSEKIKAKSLGNFTNKNIVKTVPPKVNSNLNSNLSNKNPSFNYEEKERSNFNTVENLLKDNSIKQNNNTELFEISDNNLLENLNSLGLNQNSKSKNSSKTTNKLHGRNPNQQNKKEQITRVSKSKTKEITIINKPMVLKNNSSYSIFKTKANTKFFDNNNFDDQNDIEIKFKHKNNLKNSGGSNMSKLKTEDIDEFRDNRKLLISSGRNSRSESKEKQREQQDFNELKTSVAKQNDDQDLEIKEIKEDENEYKEEDTTPNLVTSNSVKKTKITKNNELSSISSNNLLNKLVELSKKQEQLVKKISNIQKTNNSNLDDFISRLSTIEDVVLKIKDQVNNKKIEKDKDIEQIHKTDILISKHTSELSNHNIVSKEINKSPDQSKEISNLMKLLKNNQIEEAVQFAFDSGTKIFISLSEKLSKFF